MKYINEYDKFNEGILDQVRKLGPGDRKKTKDLFLGRAIDDVEAKKIFQEMKDDFEKYNKDLRKVMIIDDYKVSYYMGEYHSVKNSPMSGNYPDNRHQKKIGVSLFKSKGLEPNKGRIEIETITPNPNYDPNMSREVGLRNPTEEEREKLRAIDRNEESFKISYDVAKKIYDYFNEEYIEQYPQLKDAKYKNKLSIQSIEEGENPRLGSVDVFDKNHNEVIYPYYKLEDKEKIEKYIKNHEVYKGKNYKREYITYFSEPGESEDMIRDNIMNMDRDDVDKQNMERVYKYSK
jgi:hypothetical protein